MWTKLAIKVDSLLGLVAMVGSGWRLAMVGDTALMGGADNRLALCWALRLVMGAFVSSYVF